MGKIIGHGFNTAGKQPKVIMCPKLLVGLDQKTLEYLRSQAWPTTTEEIAKKVNVSWQTAQIHLLNMANSGKLKFKKVGKQNQWWIVENYNKEMSG